MPPPVALQLGGAPQQPNGTIADWAAEQSSSIAERAGDFMLAWREFAIRKDILNTATGFMIGGALTSIINSLVEDVLSPLIAYAWAGSDDLGGSFLVLRSGSN